MIKTYIPNALMRAAMDIARAHPIEGGDQDLDDQVLRSVLDQIQKCPADQLEALSWSLLPRHLVALCKYLPHNRYNKPVDKIVFVISCRMEPRYFSELFEQWQKYPDSRHILRLLSRFDSDDYHPAELRLPYGELAKWLSGSNVFSQVNWYILNGSGRGAYRERMERAGLRTDTPLYPACFAEYLTCCSMAQFVLEGDEAAVRAVRKASAEKAEQILLNLLKRGDGDRDSLKRFPECFVHMKRLWGTAYGGRFPKNEENAQRVYHWLCNYVEMMTGFMLDADPRRRDFWEKYLDNCEVNRVKTHKMMIFYYKYDCVIEFEQVGLIYIFDKQYFKNTVLPAIINKSTQEAKSWLRNSSHPIYSRSHQGRWELDAAVEMRKII